jgi:hypothetical protein
MQGKAAQVILVVAVVATGELGLLHESRLYQAVESWASIHVLFGTLLIGFVMLRFHRSMTSEVLISPTEIYERYRQLKRMVYLLLYGIIAIRQLIALLTLHSIGNAFSFDLASFRPRSDLRYFGLDPLSDGHAFMACGVLALAMVHVLMFVFFRGGRTRGPVASVSSALNCDVIVPTAGIGCESLVKADIST